MKVLIREIEKVDRGVLEDLFHSYIDDMSEFVKIDPNGNGKFTFKSSSLDTYWEREDHTPYFVYADSLVVGFALIRKYPDDREVYDIEQFFILRKHQGKGLGQGAFRKIVKLHQGLWQIRILIENSVALEFWKSIVSKTVGGEFVLTRDTDNGLLMNFLRFEVPSISGLN